MPILVDYSQVSMACVFAAQKHFGEARVTESMIRHMILNSLLMYKRKFGKEYGELIICCDGSNNWRKAVFPYYKASRQEAKAESAMDWDQIYEFMSTIRSELMQIFPYKVLHVDRAEGDDIIAVLSMYFADNELVQVGLDEIPQRCLIISSDKDFKQLQVFKHVRQYAPIKETYLDEPDPQEYQYELILKGDSGDGVPSVLSNDDVFVMKIRQKPLTAKRLEPLLEALRGNTPIPEEHARNIARNNTLINLIDCIPETVKSSIIEAYNEAHVAPRSGLLSYFIKHNLSNLSNEIHNF